MPRTSKEYLLSQGCLALVLLAMPQAVASRQAAPSGEDLHAEVKRVYNFEPHTLNHEQTTEKSGVLDQFWSKAKAQSAVYVPGLRKELSDFSNPPFFLFDGSQLLLSLSNEPRDRPIILAAIAHSDLRDIQTRDYFLLVQRMAAQGENTTAAAFHILEEPKFQVFIPQHSLTLAQDYCLVYMLLPTNDDFWIRPAIERLQTEQDVTAQKSLLLVLFYAQTPDADKAVSGFSGDTTKPKATTSYAKELLKRKDSLGTAGSAEATTETEASLRKARRERMKAVSDEALYDLDNYTEQIILKRK